MRCLRLALVGIGCLLGATSVARPPPEPPPSGMVIHPFAEPGGKPVTVPVILHRMFVTGDPHKKPGQALSPGRAGARHEKPPSP
jgi:hypothetical protein